METQNGYKIVNKGQDIYMIPKEKHSETIIFMHGLGDSAAGWFPVFEEDDQTPVLPVFLKTKI